MAITTPADLQMYTNDPPLRCRGSMRGPRARAITSSKLNIAGREGRRMLEDERVVALCQGRMIRSGLEQLGGPLPIIGDSVVSRGSI